jgi:hypothetical protein
MNSNTMYRHNLVVSGAANAGEGLTRSKMKQGLLTGLLTTLLCGAVSFPVEVPEAVANQGSSYTKSNTLARHVAFRWGGQSPLMPPQSHAFGKSFEEWNVLYSQWVIESRFGGGTDLSDTVGHVRFLPVEIGSGSFEFDVTLRPGTPFVASPFTLFGETYKDQSVPDDDPADPIVDFFFETTKIQVVLNGRELMAGTGTALERFRYGPVYFDEPIGYDPPQPRGENNATAAILTLGIGAVYRPLPVGQHTLVYTVNSLVFGNHVFTYHITVSP